MKVSFRSARDKNMLSLIMDYPDGHSRTVLMAEMPADGDWRADVTFHDEVERAYKSRLRKALQR